MPIQRLLLFLGAFLVNSWVSKSFCSHLNVGKRLLIRNCAGESKFIESIKNRGIGTSNVVLIVDADNVRGKSGFRLSKEGLLHACKEMARRSPFLSVLVVFDHGSREEAFMLPISEDEEEGYARGPSLARGVGVVFAGPGKSADDVIARDVPYFQTSKSRGVLGEGTIIGVVTHDMELRKRCRPKPVRLTKKERKKESKRRASLGISEEKDPLPLEVKIISSKLLAEYAEEILAGERDVAASSMEEENEDSSALALAARKRFLTQEVTLRARLSEGEAELSSCINHKFKPRLEAEVASLRKRVAALEKEGPLLVDELQALSESQVQARLAMVRVDAHVEETWERVLLAERLRLALCRDRTSNGVYGGGRGPLGVAADSAIDAYVRQINSVNSPPSPAAEAVFLAISVYPSSANADANEDVPAAMPSQVEGYAVDPVVVNVRGEETFFPLVLSQREVSEGRWASLGDVNHPRNRAVQEMRDCHGVRGVWPSALAASRALAGVEGRGIKMVELGAGAGLPSLYASCSESLRGVFKEVLATDVEAIPLAFLSAAYDAHSQVQRDGCRFSTAIVDVTEKGDTEGLLNDSIGCVVAADLLYQEDVASALGRLLGSWVSQKALTKTFCRLIVVDPGRAGRGAFLEAFRDASGKDPYFEDVHVDSEDVFDGSNVSSVGMLVFKL